MNDPSVGLSNLTAQPQYLPSDSRLARYAAHNYRPIIFVLTSLVIFFTTVKSRDAPPLFHLIFGASLLIYAGVFVWRMRMSKRVAGQFYQPHIQFWRGQATILVITLMIGLLAAHGYYQHTLWLLYTLATLLISEHNQTLAVLFTLLEVAFAYVLSSYVGWSIFHQNWQALLAFWQDNFNIGEHILGIWLVTIVFHYLVRNIHGRNKAFNQQQQWLNLITEQLARNEDPHMQRRDLLAHIMRLSGGDVILWRPRLRDNHLVDQANQMAPEEVLIAAHQPVPTLWLPKVPGKNSGRSCLMLNEPAPREGAFAQLVVPVRQLEEPRELLGVLDIAYFNHPPDQFQLETICSILLKLVPHARIILINSQQKEQAQLLWNLSIRLHQQLHVAGLAKQAVNDLVDELGFDFATISLVDDNENLIRGVEQRSANWIGQSIHPISGNDVQSRVVREGITYTNDGKYAPYLDGYIWNEFHHWRYSRIWAPMPDPASDAPYSALGTLEAGFDHKNRRHIPPDLIRLLEQYARHVGLALANAEAHERTQALAAAVTNLHAISRKMQHAAAHYEPHQMIALIGESAEKLLGADIVMLYTFEEATRTIDLVYYTHNAIEGRGKLQFDFQGSVLEHLAHMRGNHYSPDARRDPLLVKFKENGRLTRKERTFTQRQNIKSFAGLPLIGTREDVLGFLCINYRCRRHFYPELRHIIELFAAQAAVALEETYQHRLSRRVAIVRERNHLGAELHHMLSQHLFALKSYTSTACEYAQREDWGNMAVNLHKIESTTNQGIQSVKEMLDYLQEQHDINVDFVAGLKAYIQHIQPLYPHVCIRFESSPGVKAPRQVQFCLLRIAREGLTNALRHARCNNVRIDYLVTQSGHVYLTIQDDGVGFDMGKAQKKNRNGLRTMAYFAQEINGKLQINTPQEGAGTLVKVHVSPPTNGVADE